MLIIKITFNLLNNSNIYNYLVGRLIIFLFISYYFTLCFENGENLQSMIITGKKRDYDDIH